MASTKYPNLQLFLSGWFHQDFDIFGDSVNSVVAEFRRVSPEAEVKLVVADITAFVSTFEEKVDETFLREFDLDIDPTAFASSTEDFLLQVAAQLAPK